MDLIERGEKLAQFEHEFDESGPCVEVFIVKFFQSEDTSWNYRFFTSYERSLRYFEYMLMLGWSPVLESGYVAEEFKEW